MHPIAYRVGFIQIAGHAGDRHHFGLRLFPFPSSTANKHNAGELLLVAAAAAALLLFVSNCISNFVCLVIDFFRCYSPYFFAVVSFKEFLASSVEI